MKHRNRDRRISSKHRQEIESGTTKSARDNDCKRGLRASGLSLLPLALRPLLLLQKNPSKFFQTFSHSKLSLVALILPIFLSIFIFQTANVSAKSVTLTIPSAPLTLNVEPNSGTVFKKSSPGTISVATDSSYGYSLSIQSKTSNDLLNGSNKITSIVSALSEQDYKNSGDSNTWAYLPSRLGGSINTDFQPGPTTEPTTLDRIESSSEGTNYNLTLATKIDNTLPAGNYSNTFVLSATSNDPPYDDIIQNWADCDTLESEQSINLLDVRDNKIYSVAKLKDGQCWMTENLAIGKEDSEMTLTSDTSDTAGDFTLPASEEKPNPNDEYNKSAIHLDSQYGGYYTWFAATVGEGINDGKTSVETAHSICPKGWKLPTKQDFIDLDKALGGTGENRNDTILHETYMASPNNFLMGGLYYGGSNNTIGIRAMYWSSTYYVSSDLAYYFGVTSEIVNPQSALNMYDLASVRCVARPDNPKKVGSLQTVDEWGDNVEEGKTVISEDVRDNKQYTVARLADGRLWMTQNLAIGSNDSTTSLDPVNTDISEPYTLSQGSTSGFDDNAAVNIYIGNDTYSNSQPYAGYYTWAAATAETGSLISSGEAPGSICPKGWRLPTNSEYDTMFGKYNNNASGELLQTPANFVLSGNYYSSSFHASGSYGYWWSSTAVSNSGAYLWYLLNTSHGSNANYRHSGFSIRCVSRTDDPKEVGSLQTVNEWGDSVKQGKTVISEDIRDHKKYTVARLADDRLWMTKNLEIENYNLTPADSDVASNFRIPASTNSPKSSNSYTSKELHIDTTYGGYYTWFTATAGEGTQSKTGDTDHSICPKGWRLPKQSEFQALATAYGNNSSGQLTSDTSMPNFKLGGLYNSGSLSNGGTNGFYWSSTVSPSRTNNAYYMELYSTSVNLAVSLDKNYLLSVRCVARE